MKNGSENWASRPTYAVWQKCKMLGNQLPCLSICLWLWCVMLLELSMLDITQKPPPDYSVFDASFTHSLAWSRRKVDFRRDGRTRFFRQTRTSASYIPHQYIHNASANKIHRKRPSHLTSLPQRQRCPYTVHLSRGRNIYFLSALEVPTGRRQNNILWVIKGVNNSLSYKIDHGATHIFVCKK